MERFDREKSLLLLKEHNQTEALQKHALAVEATMRHFAELYGEDPDSWGVVGLLHDIDYERHPEEHLQVAPVILRENGYSEEFIHAVLSHGYGMCSEVKPEHRMEIVLYATDELTGLITAAALMRPNKSIMELEYKSLYKKFKSPAFAAGVNRDVIRQGCEMLGEELQFVGEQTILAMRKAAAELGLAGV